MQWLKTFSLVIRSNVTTLCEHFENPERTIHLLILDMEEELQSVRAKVAGVLADEIQMEKQMVKAQQEAEQWQERATQAMKRKDETAARAALEQKVHVAERARSLAREHEEHKKESQKLHRAIRDLESKIRQARHRKSLLLARLARADSTRTINQVLHQVDDRSALAQFHRLEERVERAEAMEEAYQRLDDKDPRAQDLERQFAEREQQARLQKEFDELKRRVQDS